MYNVIFISTISCFCRDLYKASQKWFKGRVLKGERVINSKKGGKGKVLDRERERERVVIKMKNGVTRKKMPFQKIDAYYTPCWKGDAVFAL